MSYIFITPHAIERCRERLGWNRNVLHKVATLALNEENSLMCDDKWVRKCIKHGPDAKAFAYADIIFIFKEYRLITIFPLNGEWTIMMYKFLTQSRRVYDQV